MFFETHDYKVEKKAFEDNLLIVLTFLFASYICDMAGIYVHIPFCRQRCTYCDFHFSTTFSSYRFDMVKAICTEIEVRKNDLAGKQLQTIYFGGGTPSLLSEDELVLILDTIHANVEVTPNAEVTLEANPDDITQEQLEVWKQHGVNRLSIGIQSFRKQDLEWMNRAHSVGEAMNCIQLAQSAGFDNLTVDLMYGLPDLSTEEWEEQILTVVNNGVRHISAYCLTIEEKTALHHWVKSGRLTTPDEDVQSEQFMQLLKTLEAHGYEQYEVSNFAKPGSRAVHNSNYWKGEWYLGIGPSAHSFNGTSRRWNVSNNITYIKGIQSGNHAFEIEELSTENQFNERLLTGLRTVYGVEREQLRSIREFPDDFESRLEQLKDAGWITDENGWIYTTKEGKLRADYIASELFC